MVNNFKLTSKALMTLMMLAIGFITYNVVLFVICGFSNHGGAFWVSYVFMLLAFATLTISGYLLKSRNMQPRDWLFGYPVLKHCTIYIILELISSVLFMGLDYKDCPWGIAFAVQMILLAVHLVFIISCFIAKEMIEDVQTNVKVRTSKIKLLQIDVEMIAESTNNIEIKEAFVKLAEQVRYSDPMSSDALNDLEEQITYVVGQAKTSASMNDVESSLTLCKKASLLLNERNKKCKVFK